MRRQRARSGFTLLELVVVLAVISLIAGLAIPRYSSAALRFRLKAAAHRVAADVSQARSAARARSAPVTITFKPGVNGYYEIADLRHLDRNEVYRNNLAEDPYRVRLASADFGGVSDLVFNGFGIGTDGEVQLTIRGWSCSVQVEGNTGVVRITGP
jgi:prepilin-type N-terminal cleavage/methylation domain-containing protein